MTKQSPTKEGKVIDEKNNSNPKADGKGKEIKPSDDETQKEKRAQRIVLKSNSPKLTSRLTLRTKTTIKPSTDGQRSKFAMNGQTTNPAKADTQHTSRRATNSTPSRSPHTTLRSRAGNSSHALSEGMLDYVGGSPSKTVHPRKLAEPRQSANTSVQLPCRSPAPNTQAAATISHQVIAEDENRNRAAKPTTTVHISREPSRHTTLSFQRPGLTGHEEAEYEHLIEPSQVTGPNSFLVKVLSENPSSHIDQMPHWELVDYPRPITPTPVSITPVYPSIRIRPIATVPKRKNEQSSTDVENTLSLSKAQTSIKDPHLYEAGSVCSPDKYKPSACSREKSDEDFESNIRSILTQSNRAQRHRGNKSQDSVKSVKWDPSIVSLGPVTSPKTTGTKVKQSEATGAKNRLKDSLKDFTNTVKDLKKRDRHVLAQLLEALRNIESDDDSSIVLVDKDESEQNVIVPRAPTNTEGQKFDHGLTSNERISKAIVVKGQKTNKEALASGLVQSASSAQGTTRERSKSTSSDQTLVGSDETCIKLNAAPSLSLLKKLNPRAPVFGDFEKEKYKETRFDQMKQPHDLQSTLQKKRQSCTDGDGAEQGICTDAKVEKYVPPALRGDRKAYSSERRPQEPVWIKIRSDQSPNKHQYPDTQDPGRNENPKSFVKWHQEPKVNVLEVDKQNQAEWLSQWLLEAAKPDHGSGIHHPAGSQAVIHSIEPCSANYEHAIEDFALSTQVHRDTATHTNDGHGLPLPLDWAPVNQSMVQWPNLPAEWHSIWPLPVAGPLIPVPPPPFNCGGPFPQGPYPLQLPVSLISPLVPEPSMHAPTAPRMRVPSEEKPGRTAQVLDPAWADMVLTKFMSKFPMTGKCQSNFPVPPIQDLDTKAAQIQQKLELLLLQQKEKKAFERRSRGSAKRIPSDPIPSLLSSQSENLIKFD
ncbi:hypothetical protein EG329_013157 [Mollisiaceae sp. DMI_Dod_QoI]|nr:hypothetical protein EG329_013157 [Helotiales sp. DMI_Dod_QoI]